MNLLNKEVAVSNPSSRFLRVVTILAAVLLAASSAVVGHVNGYDDGYNDGYDAAERTAPTTGSRPIYLPPPQSPEPEIRTDVMYDVSGYEIRLKRGGKLIDRWTFDSWGSLPVTIIHRSPCFADEPRDCLAIGRRGKTFRYEMLEREEMVNYTFAPRPTSCQTDGNAHIQQPDGCHGMSYDEVRARYYR